MVSGEVITLINVSHEHHTASRRRTPFGACRFLSFGRDQNDTVTIFPLPLHTLPPTETTPGHNKPNLDPSSERLRRDAALSADIFE